MARFALPAAVPVVVRAPSCIDSEVEELFLSECSYGVCSTSTDISVDEPLDVARVPCHSLKDEEDD